MKKAFILFFLITFGVFANTGPAEILSMDTNPKAKDNALTQNVSVQREDLTFDFSSGANEYKSNIKEVYDAKKLFEKFRSQRHNKEDGDYATYSFSTKTNYYHFSFGQLNKKDVGYADENGKNRVQNGYDDSLIKITAKYYLKNESNQTITDKTAFFSPFGNSSWSNSFPMGTREGMKAHYYIILNNMTGNIIVKSNDEKLNIKSKYIKNVGKNVGRTESSRDIVSIKPIYQFNLSFQPNEQKTLQIEYYIPKGYYRSSDYLPSYTYDFAPVFEWKGGTLSELNLKFIYNKGNRFSYCSSTSGFPEYGAYFSGDNKNFFDKLELNSSDNKNTYVGKYTNLKKGDIDALNFIDYNDDVVIHQFAGLGDPQLTCFKYGITGVEPVGEDKVRVCFGSNENMSVICDEKNSKIMSKNEFYLLHDKEL